MARLFFLGLPDYKRIREHIERQLELVHADLVGEVPIAGVDVARAWAEREYRRGFHDALKSVLLLPEQLLKDGEGEELPPEQAIEGKRIVPERESNRNPKLSRPY